MASTIAGNEFSSIPSSTVELTVACRNLIDMDVFSKSDPMCVMFTQTPSREWQEFGRTETVWNNLNPNFAKKFVIDYFFEERQNLKFQVYDIDSKSSRLADHDFLGAVECSLGEIVSAGVFRKAMNVPSGRKNSTIVLYAEELSQCKEEYRFQFIGKKLDKKDFFGKSDPFLEFWKSNESGEFTLAHRTEEIKNTLNPRWRPFTISSRALCNGDFDRTIRVVCYDWNTGGSHDYIGEFLTNVNQLKSATPQTEFPLDNEDKRRRKGSKYKNSGTIFLDGRKVEQSYTFLDYIRGGTQLHCTVAIDFTASNGDPRNPQSLHYIDQYRPNQYEMALQSVMEIIQDYDSDKKFPALGFGARLPPDGRVSHEFFMNFHPSDPHCEGIENVMLAYKNALWNVQLYGPTNFAPIINHVARFAHSLQDGKNYFILVILTDGQICDMPMTKQAVVRAAQLPMSIIIIGVGNEDFESMVELDGDEVRVSYQGMYAERDIVQFVPIRDFLGHNRDLQVAKARLAKEVLFEIPDQFTQWMKKRGVKPDPPIPRQMSIVSLGPTPQAPTQQDRRANAPPPVPPYSDTPPPYPGL